jgi:acetyl-CoA C-acetyltransferase
MWAGVARSAAVDTHARRGPDAVLDAVNALKVIYSQSWQYDDPPGRLAARLGIDPRQRLYSGIGGTTPQLLVQETAEAIRLGQLDLALITGAEALETRRQLKKAGEKPRWSFPDPDRKPFPFEAPFHPAEVAHEVFQAWLTFPIWDIARRSHLGIGPEAYRRHIGELMAPMTGVAAGNPHAWFPTRRTADELITASAANRMVGYPYTKYTVSVMDVDMAAALLVASDATADSLGVPRERRVYLRGSAYGTDPVYLAEHETMWASPAMVTAFGAALGSAGATVDDVAHFDLYSCFASSIYFAMDALGLRPDDSRGVTVTGGLPFAGGPGSGYLLHSIAAMTEVLRGNPGALGLVSGVGMHMTKHVAGVYSTTPPPDIVAAVPTAGPTLASPATLPIVDAVDPGTTATVATYTVAHGRGGEPEWGLAVCDLAGGSRCYARVEDPDLLDQIEREEWVGARVELVPVDRDHGTVNVVKP